jgi:hypothetical protein
VRDSVRNQFSCIEWQNKTPRGRVEQGNSIPQRSNISAHKSKPGLIGAGLDSWVA